MGSLANPFDRENYITAEPDCIVLGRHAGWKLLNDLDNALFTLKYVIHKIGDSTTSVTVTGTRVTLLDGNDYWVFEVPSTTSSNAPWTTLYTAPDNSRWDLIITEIATSNEAVIASGFINVFPTAADRRTHAEIMLTKINSIIEGRADNDVGSYTIGSRSISKMTIAELTKWRDYYVTELRYAKTSVNGSAAVPDSNTVRVRFV